MILFCPRSKCSASVDVVVCLYNCKVGTKSKCSQYLKHWELIKDFTVDEKYLEKYGLPERPVPLALRKRRKKRGT